MEQACPLNFSKPLDFDGSADSIYHAFGRLGNVHMDYIRYRGEFSDVPIDQIRDTLERCYGPLLSAAPADFYQDLNGEKI